MEKYEKPQIDAIEVEYEGALCASTGELDVVPGQPGSGELG